MSTRASSAAPGLVASAGLSISRKRHHPSPSGGLREQGLEATWADCERRLGLFLVQLLRDRHAAEDVLQETWIVASRTDFPSIEQPTAWLYGVARRVALKHMRSDRRRRHYETQASVPESIDPATESIDAVFVSETLERALDPDERALVLLRYRHGFSAIELADMLRISPEAARKRLSRATTRLAAAIRSTTNTSGPGTS